MPVKDILSIIFASGCSLALIGLVVVAIVYVYKYGFKRDALDIELREYTIKALKKYLYRCYPVAADDDDEGK